MYVPIDKNKHKKKINNVHYEKRTKITNEDDEFKK